MRVFHEVGLEADITGQLYCGPDGLEKEEIAERKFRAVSTINNQLQKLFSVFGVKNGRQLCKIYYERLQEMGVPFDYQPIIRSAIACCLLCVLVLDGHFEMRRQRTSSRTRTNIELTARVKTRARGRDIPLAA